MPSVRPEALPDPDQRSRPNRTWPDPAAKLAGLARRRFWKRFPSAVRSLRFRLMLWNSLAMALLALAVLFSVRERFQHTLLHELDDRLDADAREIELAMATLPATSPKLHEELNVKAAGHAQQGWFVRLTDQEGHSIFTSTASSEIVADVTHVAQSSPVTHGDFRIVHWVQDAFPNCHIEVGASLQPLRSDAARMDSLMMASAGIMLLIVPLCGYWLAGRVTRPLAKVSHAVTRLRPRQLNERLPLRNTGDELDRLSGTFNKLLDRIAAYLAEHRDFLANAAHELRSPLAAIRSTAEVALHGQRTPDEYEELLQGVITECESLELLVNQLLLLAETEADCIGSVGEEVALHEVVARSVDMFRAVAESRGLELTLSDLPAVCLHGNRHHLRQLVNNLVDNAIKFTPSGGRITVEMSYDSIRGAAALRISDTGIGICEEDLSRVFQRFYRVDRSRRRDVETRGTGLGLNICQAIAQAHSGHIGISSRVGAGTQVTVTFSGTGQVRT